MPHSGHFYFGGSGWIRTTSGLSQQIYSLPRLSNSGARPIFIPPAFAKGFGGQWIFSPCFAAVKILGAGSGNRTRISSLEGLHTSLCTMPATNSKPCDYILNLPKRKYFSQGHIRLSDSVDNIFHFQQEFHIIPTGL